MRSGGWEVPTTMATELWVWVNGGNDAVKDVYLLRSVAESKVNFATSEVSQKPDQKTNDIFARTADMMNMIELNETVLHKAGKTTYVRICELLVHSERVKHWLATKFSTP